MSPVVKIEESPFHSFMEIHGWKKGPLFLGTYKVTK